MNDKEFLIKYENLLNKGYCDCNEMNCIDNNSPRRILNIAVKQQKEIERLNNIIKELEKELREGSFDVYFCSTNTQKTFKSNEIIIKSLILDKLKELKENNKNV